MSADRTLAIIGAGPKALAVAAKSKVLSEFGISVPEIHVFEKNKIAANWSGEFGYTNGAMSLGTPPEHDIGHPYNMKYGDKKLSNKINQEMLRYSYTAFLVSEGHYAEWIDRGRPSPTHKKWSSYLFWIYKQIKDSINLHISTVNGVSLVDNKWQILSVKNGVDTISCYDSLMLTGPGMEKTSIHSSPENNLLTALDFWRYLPSFHDQSIKVAIIGSGEQAASIVQHIIKMNNPRIKIEMICSRGTILTRGDSFSENRFYSEPVEAQWTSLSLSARKFFIRHMDLGAFSSTAMKVLDDNDCIAYIPGVCNSQPIRIGRQWHIAAQHNSTVKNLAYDVVIYATGFSQMKWINDLLSKATVDYILAETQMSTWDKETIMMQMGADLSLLGLKSKLYWPMMSGLAQGPGFSNLCCLGSLSDRVCMSESFEINKNLSIVESTKKPIAMTI